MLEWLRFQNLGPADALEIRFHERMNFLTGDNGLGKTFMLDAAWWILTGSWAGEPLIPNVPALGSSPMEPLLDFSFRALNSESVTGTNRFVVDRFQWSSDGGPKGKPGLVVYAQVDGGFSVWDPARNHGTSGSSGSSGSYHFSAQEIWEGSDFCEGLIRDWASWQRENGEAFAQLKALMRTLSPSDSELLEPGELRRISLEDPRRHPTLKMPYGQDVPLVHASAGMRRIVALAYLLVWARQEHLEACRLLNIEPTSALVFLVDEVEAHLHPQWQRRIVPALLKIMEVLTCDQGARVQLIAATHSPLVLASAEPFFQEELDGLFLLQYRNQKVVLEEQSWSKQGDVANWLVSDAFGLQQGRSFEAERAIEAAEAWMRDEKGALPDDLATLDGIDRELKRVLPGHDAFWPRWVVWVEKREMGGR